MEGKNINLAQGDTRYTAFRGLSLNKEASTLLHAVNATESLPC